jgi:dolichyl-phosphate-mannose-protein mannosyltransferase
VNTKLLVGAVCILTIIPIWVTFGHLDLFSQIQQVVKSTGVWGDAIFVAVYAIATLLILPVTAFNILGGALYGGLEGLVLTSLGALLSAGLAFVFARWFSIKFVKIEERWSNVSNNLVAGGLGYSFAARLFPLIPYGIVSFAAGLSPIKRRDYLLGTLLGTPLGIAPFVFLGSTGVQMQTSRDLLPLLVSSAGLAILVIAGTWYRQRNQTNSPNNENIDEKNFVNNSGNPENQKSPSLDWYLILGGLGIFAIALFLRLWQLDKIPYPVFDETYFPKYAEEYLEGKPSWEGHPPLGKFFIMLGIVLFGHNEIGYRIASAIFGSLMPLLAIGVAYRFTYNRSFAQLSGVFLLSDGLFLVESRLGLINVFLVAFGLASQIFLLAGLEHHGKLRTFLFACSGLMLSASASVKWNGLGFSFLIFLLLVLVGAIAKFFPHFFLRLGLLKEITTVHWWQYLLCFLVIPIAFYLVQWLPLFMLNSGGVGPESGLGAIHAFWESLVRVHQHIIWWHSTSSVTTTDPAHPSHPYCSTAISWAVSARPINYFFQNQDGYFSVIDAMGNPILWWFSTLAIVATTVALLIPKFREQMNIGITNYLLLGYFANYAPWLLVKRCLFIYHYMSAAVFSFMALAWLVSQMLTRDGSLRYLGYGIIVMILLSQVFFMPIWFGLPILSSDFYHRMWFMPDKVPGFNWI